MIELYANVPIERRQQLSFYVGFIIKHTEQKEWPHFIINLSHLCNEDEANFLNFYFNMKLEQLK